MSLPSLPSGTRFSRGSGSHKYTATLPDGKRVHFGHKDYKQYKDRVPKSKGGGLYTHLNHGDSERRRRYQTRHKGVLNKDGIPAYKVKYTPAWFSYYFLW